MSKQISTKTTIRNLTAEIKKTFVKKDAFTPVQAAANAAIKSLGVDGNTVNFYTSTDKSGTAAFSVDFPSELFLDQTKTTFVAKFKFDAATYPGATDPKLDGKPVMVLAVKGENPDSCTYSFLSMAALVDTYKAKAVGKDASTTVTIAGYEVDVKVNVSAAAGNALTLKDDGLYVPTPEEVDISGKADKVTGATTGNLAALDGEGNLTLLAPGREIAERIYSRHRLLTHFFMQLGVDEKTAAEDACKAEHILSEQTLEKIRERAIETDAELGKTVK